MAVTITYERNGKHHEETHSTPEGAQGRADQLRARGATDVAVVVEGEAEETTEEEEEEEEQTSFF